MTSIQLGALIEAIAADVATFARSGQYGTAALEWLEGCYD